MTDDKKNIFYRPQLNIEKDYSTNGVILHDNTTDTTGDNTSQTTEKTETQKTIETALSNIDELIKIRKVLPLLPDKTINVVTDIIDNLIAQTVNEVEKLEEIDKKEQEDKKNENNNDVYENAAYSDTDDDDEDDSWPEVTSSGFTFNVQLNKDIWDMAYDQMLADSTAIKEDFSTQMNDIFQKYIYQLVSTMDEVGIDTPEYLNYGYEGESVTGIPTDMQHLNDIIVRNQDILNEYQELFKKTHDLYNTNTILTAFDVISQERIRYLKEKFVDNTKTYIDIYNKNLLKDVRDEYEVKYRQVRSDFYKYLNSTASFTKDMLDINLNTAIAKCGLLSKDINIYATKEYSDAEYTNTATSTLADLTKTVGNKPTTATDTSKTDTKTDNKDKTDTKTDTSKSASTTDIADEVKNTVDTVKTTTKNIADGAVKTIRTTVETGLTDILGSIGKGIDNAASKLGKQEKTSD